MTIKPLRFLSALTLVGSVMSLVGIAGCSAGGDGTTFGGGSGKSGSGGSSGTAGEAGAAGSTAGSAGSIAGSAGSAGSIAGNAGSAGTAGQDCGGTTQTAQKIPLDIYMMLDQSGSMTSEVDPGTSKWQAVVTAMTDFWNNTPADGLGIGLQFFSVIKNNAPASCTNNNQCNGAGQCVDAIKACRNTFNPDNTLILCTSNSDCPGDTCEAVGLCSGGVYACFPSDPFGTCDIGEVCQSYNKVCSGRDSCDINDYATPLIGIANLAQNRSALVAQFNGRVPDTNTPTLPATKGALQYAKSWAEGQGQGHKTIVILVTDGFPSVCLPNGDTTGAAAIQEIGTAASAARTGTPGIDTYVIGVFAPDEAAAAQSNLNQIAQSGAGRDAFIISSNVTQQLTQALDEIRGNALSCEYNIPADTTSNASFTDVFVQFTPNGGTAQNIGYVGNAGACDPNTGGWYYDPPYVAGGPTPTKILVCPSTCTQFTGAG
ncbi:MAG: vWA domain-containing protein, partial [Polyangiaceae bacterium]